MQTPPSLGQGQPRSDNGPVLILRRACRKGPPRWACSVPVLRQALLTKPINSTSETQYPKSTHNIQGYLAHKKLPHPSTLQ